MINLLNFIITYIIIFATCFDSYESTLGINFKTYCIYCFTVYMSCSFLSKYCNRHPFLHYKTRVNIYLVLGRGVVGSCFWCPLLFVFGGWGVSRVGKYFCFLLIWIWNLRNNITHMISAANAQYVFILSPLNQQKTSRYMIMKFTQWYACIGTLHHKPAVNCTYLRSEGFLYCL
jgi:hypothetical protein